MKRFEIAAPIFLKNGMAVKDFKDTMLVGNGNAEELACAYDNAGLDAIVLFDFSKGDKEHDQSLGIMKKMAGLVDIPMYGAGNIQRVEDVKKLIYAGCRRILLNYSKSSNIDMTKEVADRFGKEKMFACVRTSEELDAAKKQAENLEGILLMDEALITEVDDIIFAECMVLTSCVISDKSSDAMTGICSYELQDPTFSVMEYKHQLASKGLAVNTYESSLSWEQVKKNSDGMLPVVVQDYKTQEVLMVAYMNQEAFETTIRTGRMTYWSRSRQELWVKGLTSGHFQYVKELRIDCDNDTLLAKVMQIGAACHTGNRSCFYTSILKKEYDDTNPLKVFEDVFSVIEDRKVHPKEGSYTNYLFEKGIDKILKKVGEEATEIVIAAKNPDPQEVVYELSDFLYHAMVLMAERGISWPDITKELARR